jgi:predicted ATPase
MYIQSFEIENLKSFSKLSWSLDAETNPHGWHVLIGPNGAGKTTLLCGLAYTLIGQLKASASRIDTAQWVRSEQKSGYINLYIQRDSNFDLEQNKNDEKKIPDITYASFNFFIRGEIVFSTHRLSDLIYRTLWADNNIGWFSAGFGPFRRFTGGNNEYGQLFTSHPKLARHLSLFGEDVALSEALEWLRLLKFKKLESKESYTLLDSIFEFVNQDGFLPFDAKLLDVTSEQILFSDGNGVKIPVLELSDGYRSILSLTFELIRQMSLCYQNIDLFNTNKTAIIAPGVVLIDEVDAHLHPNWQRSIGPWLCRLFPQIQFIVTTHSTFVCQEATSIWRLPDPGTDDEFKRVTGEELTRLLLGDATLALETHAFGLEQNRSDKANELLDELAALNLKAYRGELDDQETKRHNELTKLLQPVLF